jgi:hypothetical protein
VSYLQSLCVAESQLIEQEYLGQLYDTTYELSAADLSVQNPSRDGLPVPDLRRAIHQLQFLCSSTAKQGTGGDVGWQTHSLEDMIDWTRLTEAEQQTRSGTYHSDLLSYVDSVAQHPLEVSFMNFD